MTCAVASSRPRKVHPGREELKVEKTPAAHKRARRCSVWQRACAAGYVAGTAFAGVKGFLQAEAAQVTVIDMPGLANRSRAILAWQPV